MSDTLHRFWCARHGDYTRETATHCGQAGTLGPMEYPRPNRCWCRSERRHTGMGHWA